MGYSLALSSTRGIVRDFANNTYLGESVRNDWSHLKSALFALLVIKIFQYSYFRKIESPDLKYGRVFFRKLGAHLFFRNMDLTVDYPHTLI